MLFRVGAEITASHGAKYLFIKEYTLRTFSLMERGFFGECAPSPTMKPP